jgi:hypothetical protein
MVEGLVHIAISFMAALPLYIGAMLFLGVCDGKISNRGQAILYLVLVFLVYVGGFDSLFRIIAPSSDGLDFDN